MSESSPWHRREAPKAGADEPNRHRDLASIARMVWSWLLPPNPFRIGAGLLIAVAGPAVATLAAHSAALRRFPAMLMAFAVILAAVAGRLLCAAVGAAVSAFLMDYYWLSGKRFHLPGAKGLLALGLFMTAGVVASYLVVRVERSRDAERQLRGELERVLDVTDAALSLLPFDDLVQQVAVRLRRALHADAAALLLPSTDYRYLFFRAAEGLAPEQAPLRMGAGILGRVATAGEPVLAGRLTPEEQAWGLAGMSSLVAAPLTLGESVLGVVYASSATQDQFGPDELRLLHLVSVRAASALERTRLHEQRDRMSRAFERSLIPSELPHIPGVELAALYLPFGEGDEIGGDFYDAFPLSGGTWGVAIGDVAGKGPEAAAVMGLLRHSMRAVSRYEDRPSRILAALNEILLSQDTNGERRFCTVACLRVHPNADRARVTVSLAGHPSPVVRNASGNVRSVGEPGDLLGVFDDPRHHDVAVDLEMGDAIVLFTDGLIETREEGAHDLMVSLTEALEGGPAPDAQSLLNRIREQLVDARESLEDDVAILVMRKSSN
jgi:serine phosphatase RsbU (regulator of sigma subunit)